MPARGWVNLASRCRSALARRRSRAARADGGRRDHGRVHLPDRGGA
ncbi:hypothetical protein LV779_11890 [Streptomyces thinghirensis]|nr:hypothetical protein [Streptomyces thinghirensis]